MWLALMASECKMTANSLYKFRLFVAGDTPNSAQAIGNLTALCVRHLPGRHHIDVVDVFKEPAQALSEGIYMTPTLVRLAPGELLKIVGTLSSSQTVLLALGLDPGSA